MNKKNKALTFLELLEEVNVNTIPEKLKSHYEEYRLIFDKVAKLHENKAFVIRLQSEKEAQMVGTSLRSHLKSANEFEIYSILKRGKCVYIKNNY